MSNIDHMSEETICLVLRTSNLTLKNIIAVLQKALEILKKKNDSPRTKIGNQSVKKLIKKHSDIEFLDSNFSKKELQFLKKELQSLGVDFSCKKVDRNEYSLFFSAKNRNLIEKGLKNAINTLQKNQTNKKIFSLKELSAKQNLIKQNLKKKLPPRTL